MWRIERREIEKIVHCNNLSSNSLYIVEAEMAHNGGGEYGGAGGGQNVGSERKWPGLSGVNFIHTSLFHC